MKTKAEEWKRVCPSCGRELSYASYKGLKVANKLNRVCKVCSNVGDNNPNFGKLCPEHVKQALRDANFGRVVPVETRLKMSECMRGKKNPMYGKSCHWSGTHLSDERKRSLSEMRKGKPISKQHRQNISAAQMGRRHTDETRRKMRISKIEHIKATNGGMAPSYNAIACEYFEKLERELGWSGLFGTKNGEFYVSELGYFVDYYEPTRNIVIEYDEPKHYNIDNSLRDKDVRRMGEISKHLGCQFYRYNERTGELKKYV